MVLPQPFTTASPILASYDYTDLEEGAGIVVVYPFFAEDSAGASYNMNSNIYYSTLIATKVSSNSGTFSKTFSLSPFNMPRTIKGTGYFTIPWYYQAASSDNILTAYPRITLYKDATQIVQTSGQVITGAAGVSIVRVSPFVMTIPETHFNIGETLKVKVEVIFVKTSGTGTGIYEVGHDPKNRDGTYLTTASGYITQMRLDIPFKINL